LNAFRWTIAFSVLLLLPHCASAQDATQIAAGGIISLNDAPLTVAKEHLAISPAKVVADYTFRNDTSVAIETPMAFVVPVYTLELTRDDQRRQGFKDAEFLLGGSPVGFDVEARALLHGKDVTAVLEEFRIDIASFGHFDHGSPDLRRLGPRQVDHLVELGLYARASRLDDDPQPEWTVAKRYVRDVTFPPGMPVRIQLSYSPVPGSISDIAYVATGPDDMTPPGSLAAEAMPDIRKVCPTRAELAQVQKYLAQPHHFAGLTFVDFYLTGTHAWKTPVGEFTLEIDSPAAATANSFALPATCWQGQKPVVTATSWVARATNFTSQSDLRVGWFVMDSREF